jgi:thioredoxin-related protein
MKHAIFFALASLMALAPLASGQTTKPAAATGPSAAPAASASPAMPDLSKAPAEPQPPHAAWFTDYQTAHAKAVAEKKHLLLVFTGADWIALCRLFDQDILNQPAFLDGIASQFVPVRLDYPKKTVQLQSTVAQNRIFMRAYRVSSFPTLILTDTDGRPYGINGYQPVPPANYAKVIGAMRDIATERDALFAKAAAAPAGAEKARLLAQGVPNLPGNLPARYYRPQLEEIIANDPKDETGKVAKCRRMISDVEYADAMQKLEDKVDWAGMLKLTDDYIAANALRGAEKQHALFNKVGIFQKQANTTELVKSLMEIVAIDEKTPQGRQAKSALDQLRARKLQQELSPP